MFVLVLCINAQLLALLVTPGQILQKTISHQAGLGPCSVACWRHHSQLSVECGAFAVGLSVFGKRFDTKFVSTRYLDITNMGGT